jgi:hypothetical protein
MEQTMGRESELGNIPSGIGFHAPPIEANFKKLNKK